MSNANLTTILQPSETRNIIWGPVYDKDKRGNRRHEDKYDFLVQAALEVGFPTVTAYDVLDAMKAQELEQNQLRDFMRPYFLNIQVATALMEGGQFYPPYQKDLFFQWQRNTHEVRGNLPLIAIAPLHRDFTSAEMYHVQDHESFMSAISSMNWEDRKDRIAREYQELLQNIG